MPRPSPERRHALIPIDLQPRDIELLEGTAYAARVPPLIEAARRSVHLLVYASSAPLSPLRAPVHPLYRALLALPARRVIARAVVDTSARLTGHRPTTRALGLALSTAGWHVRHHDRRPPVHTKLLLIDGNLSIIGSHNATLSSLSSPWELSILSNDPHIYRAALDHWFAAWHSSPTRSGPRSRASPPSTS